MPGSVGPGSGDNSPVKAETMPTAEAEKEPDNLAKESVVDSLQMDSK